MKIAFIHSDKKIATGAHYINDLINVKLKKHGVFVKNFYPKTPLTESPVHLKGLANILFFYSLLEKRKDISKYDLVQGTTYTPLPFLASNGIAVISHFGSTTQGFLDCTPLAKNINKETQKIWYELREKKIVELNVKTRRPMRDIAEIEKYVAKRAKKVIAVSENVKKELIAMNVPEENIEVVHNAIEDYWFEENNNPIIEEPRIVFLGRLGRDSFTLKLKGADRLIHLYKKFPKTKKTTICMTTNKKLKDYLKSSLGEHDLFVNFKKDLIPNILKNLKGSILFLPSRYEGFSLSLIEGMSQGLIPVTYPVGVAPEIIRDGANGYLVNSQKEAITRIESLFANKKLRQYMSEKAKETANEFRSEKMAEQLVSFYKKVINK
ncbi:MAG: glycosyltransferase family 4 protein [Candidatus Pacebacteria bacterium]|nr:glycosyltransferase family 4 protein [Candidatus Paceibacterota bacterium]MDD5013285.1 glycosyltransferase family 4 protein [Candidatus Paceibacterota bacterium]MDD5752744.1 glycosyltransferase family 4 protein [Candidatus Paceibacterota bacterium]